MTQTPFSPQQPGQPPYRQLRRSQTDRKIAGVCGGIAEYFRVDPTFVRLVFLVVAVLTGGGFIFAYILAAFLMPDAPSASSPPPHFR